MKSLPEKTRYGRKTVKMSRGIEITFTAYSNAAESYATQMSAEKRAYTIRNILTEAAEFRCQNCQLERTLCPAGTNFSSGKILSRRSRIFRGLYLSKETLEYHRRVFDSVFKNQTRKYTLTVNQNHSERD